LKLEDQGGSGGALIATVVPGGAAARAGCVAGETIVAINAQSLVGAGYDTVLKTVKAAGLTFTLTTAKAKAPQEMLHASADSSTITFARQKGQPLGLKLEDQGGSGGALIATVVPGGVGARAGCVGGETIIAINAQSLVGAGYETVLETVKAAGLTFTMTTAKAKAPQPTPPTDSSTVTFTRQKGQSLGLKLVDQGKCGGALIKTVVPGSVGARAGCVAGEMIVAINAQSVVGATYGTVLAAVKAAGLTFTMTTTMTFKSEAERSAMVKYIKA
jgi:S1-C subfamily serine protease